VAQIYNPLTRKHQEVSDSDAQYLSRPRGGDNGTRMLKNPLDGKLYPVAEEEYQFLSRPGRTLAQAYPAPAAAVEEEEPGVGLLDYGKSIMAGGASVGEGFGWLARQVGAEGIGRAIEETSRDAVDYWNDSLSDSAKDALSREFVTKGEDGSYSWGDASLHTVGLMGAQSLLGTAAGIGAGAGVSQVLKLFANPFGRSVLASAAKSGSLQAIKKLRLVDRVIGAAGFGVGEGLLEGASAGVSVEQAVKRLPPEQLLANPRYQQIFGSTDERMSELERHQYATDTIAKEAGSQAGLQSGLVAGLLGAPMGAFFGPLLNKSGRLASTRLASAGVGAAGEAAQEALQSGASGAITTTTRQRYGEQDLDALEESLNQAIGGAAAGGALGGAIGAVDYRPEREDVPRGNVAGSKTKPDTATPLKNAAMRAAQAGAPREAVVAEVTDNSRPILDRIKKLRTLAAAAQSQPEPAPPPPTFRDVLEPEVAAAPPKERTKPSLLDVTTRLDELAHSAAGSPLNPIPPPTPEQIEAENYETGRVPGAEIGMRSLEFVVENPRGSDRGTIMRNHYGRIPGTIGGDGMALDFFLGNEDSEKVYLYHHLDDAGRFSQHKALVNMSREEADETLKAFYARRRDGKPGPKDPKDVEAMLGRVVELSRGEFEQWVASGKTGAPHPKAKLEGPRRFEGQPTRAITPAGEPINAKYALVDLGDLTSSHTLTGKPNSNFPQELQPRDRSRAGLRQWIIDTAARFEPALSVEGAGAGEGAPIVGPDGIVESGNGRTMLISKLYLDKSNVYRDYLKANAAKFGFTPEQVDALPRPILVRQRTDPMDMAARARFATEANRPTLSTFSATEQANSDARALSDQEIGVFAPSADGNVLADSNRLFMNAFVGKLPATERAGLLTAEGGPTRQLSNRVQAAIFAKAYQDDRLLTLMAEDADPDVRNIIAALTTASPAFARARAAGVLDQADVVTPLVGAIEAVRAARAKGQAVEEYLDQGGLFEKIPPEVDRMARFIDKNIRSAKRMGEAFTGMASFLENEASRRQSGSLFGEEAPLDVNLAMQAANQRLEQGGSQGAMFSRPAYPERLPGESDKAYMKRAIDTQPAPESVPFAPEKLFTSPPGTQLIPIDQLVSSKSAEENAQGLKNAPKRFLAAFHGVIPPRPPIVVRPLANGQYEVLDGNGTLTALRAMGWESIPAQLDQTSATPETKQAFLAAQANWTIGDIYSRALGNQAQLDEAGKEIAAALGVEWVNPGIKERARLEEKIAKEAYEAPGQIADVVRGAILTESSADADAVIRQLAERFPVFDKGLAVTSSGYVDHKVLVRFPDGQVAEVQVAPRAVFRASESIGHVWYDQQRAMLVNKRVPAERMAEYLALEARQIALYSEALAETPGWLDAALAAAPPTVSQALNRSRQATGSMAAALESTTATSTSTQGLPGEGMTNAARSPSTSPVTAGRSSSAPNERADFTGSSTTESVAQVERVKRWLAPDLKALEPIIRVNVVYSTEELPDPNAPPDVEGAYTQDGEVWFVARNIPTEKRAREVGRHEVFGHMAIERNGEFKARLAAIERAIRAGNFRDLVREVRRRQGLLPAVIEAREVVALMAERGIQSPLLGSLRTALRKVGRDLGLDMPLDEGELNALVAVAARDLRHDAAIMQDFRAAQGLPAVKALEKADPTELEILSAIDAIYDDDALDHDYRRAPSGKRVEPGGQMYHQRAYHGSAHEFPRFSLDHIGKGEGAQSYGWGLYFTSQKEIAEHYRNKLSPRPTVTVGGREVVLDFYLFDRSLAPERIEQIVAKRLALLQKAEAELGHPLPVQELIQTVEKDLQRSIKMAIATDDSVVLQSVQKQLATLKDMVAAGLDVKTHGKVYEVEIPEDHTLADYDKLLENQPPKVRRALREVAKAAPTTTSNYGGGGSPERLLAMLDDPTLQATFERFLMVLSDAYADTKREPGTSGNPADRAAALALREAGVLGHKYKGHGSGVPNFVIYDDGVIETKAMYSRRGGQDQDLFGDDRKTEQEIADEQRRRDERRSPNRDVNADTGDPNDLFTTRRQQMLFSRSGKPTTTKAFKAWFGKSKVVDEDGKPRVVYHGTTGDFDTFDPAKATTESDLGAGLYFTSERRDVQHNYAGFGPDLTARLERRAEDIASSYGYDGAIGNDLKNELGLADNETPEDRTTEEVTAAAMAIARRQLASQNDGFTMPVYLKIENPLVIGNSHERGLDETFLEYNWPRDEEGEPTGEPDTGTLVDFLDGLSAVASRYDGGDVDDLRSRILELGLDGGIKASVIFDLAKSTEQFNYFQDESGNLVSNEILRQAFEHAGFDGIIDYTVDKKFGSQRRVGRSMEGMDEDTVHYVAFRPEQVKSAIGNSGAFDPNNPSILMSRAAAIPGSVPNDITEMLERLMAKPNEAVTIKDRAREQWRKLTGFNVDAIRQGVIDSFDAVKQLEKGQAGALLDAAESPYKAALATKNLPSVMAAVMMRGVPVYKDGAFQLEAGRKGVIEIFQPLTEHPDGNLLPLWELYAAAKRAKQLKKEGREKLFSDEDIRKAEALAQQYPILEEVAKDWEAFNNQLLDLAVERGVLDPVAVKAWRQNFYVPFYRAMEEAGSEGPKTQRGIEGHGGARVKKRLRGSEKPLGHVFENLLMNTAYLIDESFKNTAMQKIAAMADGVAMEKIPLNWEAVQLPAGQLEKALDQMGASVTSRRGIRPGEETQAVGPTRGPDWRGGLSNDEREEWLKLFRRVAPVGKDVVKVFVNGKPVYYRVTDDLLLRSIANMGYDSFADVWGLFRGSKRLLTGAITLDPAFMMANWVRDTLSAWVTSDVGIKPVIDSLRGAKAAFSMDSEVLAMMAAGGGGGGVYDMQPAELRSFLVDKLGSKSAAERFMGTIVSPKNWLRVWRKIGNAAENANRVAIYRAVRKAGGSVAEAAYQARDVLNFTMSGDYAAMRWLTATVPFMNARIQGLYRLYRGAQDNPGAFAMKGLALTAATLALLLRNNDEEEYERLPEWDKDMYWHFWLGGEHYRLPKPFEVGAIFGTLPERMYRLGTGRDSASIAKERIMAMVSETFAFNPIPQVAKPLIEQYANKSFFTGSPIVGMAEANLSPEAQYSPWTSDTLRAMAEALPDFAPAWMRSPQRLEAMLRGYLGATGMYALQAADTLTRTATDAPPRPARKLYDAPVVRRFLQDPNPRTTKYADQLYTMLEEANEIFSTINRYREQGRASDARELLVNNRDKLAARTRLNRIATRVRAVNNQMQMVLYNPSMSPAVKRERLDVLTARKNELTAMVAPLAELF
jgi:hypothetical protein